MSPPYAQRPARNSVEGLGLGTGWLGPGAADGNTSVTGSRRACGERGSWMTIFTVVFQMGKLRSYTGLGRGSPARCPGVGEGPGPGLLCSESVSPCLAPSWEGGGSSVRTVPRATQPGVDGPGSVCAKRVWSHTRSTPVDSSSPKQVLTHLSSGWAQSCGTDAAGTWPSHQIAERLGVHPAGDQLPAHLLCLADYHRPRRTSP